MKNKAEREEFLRGYRKWCKDECAIIFGITFYTHWFKNGAQVIVTECIIPGYDNKPLKETESSYDVRYNLIIPETDGYNPFDPHSGHSAREFWTYNLKGISIGTIVDYMTKRRGEI